MYSIAIALFHEALGNNPGRISKKLIEYVNAFNWHDIDFPATYDDYVLFEKLNDVVALNILYVPLNEANISPEYISKGNFDKKTSGSTSKNKWYWEQMAFSCTSK